MSENRTIWFSRVALGTSGKNHEIKRELESGRVVYEVGQYYSGERVGKCEKRRGWE